MDRSLAAKVASANIIDISGDFQRHASRSVRTLTGSASGGRWGREGAYPVLYLARPTAAVVVEAYRHLVDPVEGMTGDHVGPRRILTARVEVGQILDLREAGSRAVVGLAMEDVLSPVGEWDTCQQVGQAAHQLRLHGIIAPSAGGNGETLALFEQHLEQHELPVLVGDEIWATLPGDPRRLRVVTEGDG